MGRGTQGHTSKVSTMRTALPLPMGVAMITSLNKFCYIIFDIFLDCIASTLGSLVFYKLFIISLINAFLFNLTQVSFYCLHLRTLIAMLLEARVMSVFLLSPRLLCR